MMWKVLRNLIEIALDEIGCTVKRTDIGTLTIYRKRDQQKVIIDFRQGTYTLSELDETQ